MDSTERSELARRLWADPTYRANVRAARKAQWQRPEFRTKRLAICKSEEFRDKLKAAFADPELKARRSAASKRYWADPANREASGKKVAATKARQKLAKQARSSPPPPPPPAFPDPMSKRMRKCLGGCDRMFMSAHAGNRICPSCAGRI